MIDGRTVVAKRRRRSRSDSASNSRTGAGCVTTPAAELRLMNGFELLQGGAAISVPMSVQRLLAFLAFQEHPVQRVFVAGKLWLDSAEERAFASLRTALWRANQPGVPLV